MKKYLFILPLLAFLLGACGDDDIKAPKGERNWMILEDSDDPLDHQRYEIFRDFGVPVFYNDTIGREERYSMSGSYTYYEKLQVFYNPGYPSVKGRFTLLEDRMNVKPMLDYLQTELLPRMKDYYIPSILLVDSLVVAGDSTVTVYKGFNTIVCGKMKDFATMEEEERKWYIGSVMRGMLINSFLNEEANWLETEFYAKSLEATDNNNRTYNSTEPGNYYVQQVLSEKYPGQTDKYKLGNCGFLDIKVTYFMNKPLDNYARVPSREGDVTRYMEAYFAMTEEEFEERWGEYPVIMAKYEVFKEKMEEYGF